MTKSRLKPKAKAKIKAKTKVKAKAKKKVAIKANTKLASLIKSCQPKPSYEKRGKVLDNFCKSFVFFAAMNNLGLSEVPASLEEDVYMDWFVSESPKGKWAFHAFTDANVIKKRNKDVFIYATKGSTIIDLILNRQTDETFDGLILSSPIGWMYFSNEELAALK